MHIHFETRANKPAVFRMTAPAIRDALTRSDTDTNFTVNEDPNDFTWLDSAHGLVTSNDVLRAPGFPLASLATVAPNLRWIHVIGAGIEPLLPLDWLPSTITLTNNSGIHAPKTRESMLMALLALNARLPAMVSNQAAHRWHPIFTPTIAGRRLLVVGLGDMGAATASAGKSLGMHVTGIRRTAGTHPDVDIMLTPDDIDAELPKADFIVLAAPLTPATRNMLDRRRIFMLKTGAALCNIGRGGLLDHQALAEALTAGTLSGAILDVFDPEPPPPSSLLWDVPNLIMMPHVTSDDLDHYLPLTYDLVFANAARLAAGEPLLNRVDPLLGY